MVVREGGDERAGEDGGGAARRRRKVETRRKLLWLEKCHYLVSTTKRTFVRSICAIVITFRHANRYRKIACTRMAAATRSA